MLVSRKFKLIVLAAGIITLYTSPAFAQFNYQGNCPRSGLVDNIKGVDLDWSNECYYATGEGTIPSNNEEPNRARAHLKAKGYARMQAISNILIAIDGTSISSTTSGKDYIAQDPQLRQTIEGYVSKAELVSDKQQITSGDTVVVATVRMPLYGENGIGSAILKSMQRQDTDAPVSVEKCAGLKEPSIPTGISGPFTSLIVDAGGLNLHKSISPRIRLANGSEIWGKLNTNIGILQGRGTVAYAGSIDEAKQHSRAGNNPLIVKAISRAGNLFMCDAVITDLDADRISRENKTSGFLDNFNVIFVVDTSH